jgi:hypothetical protein
MVASAFLMVVLASCGKSSSKSNTSSAATTPSPPSPAASTTTTTTATADVTADTAKAHQINLQLSDFPAGWTSTPADPQSAQDPAGDATAKCLGAPPPSQADTVDVDSDDFHNGEVADVSSNVGFARTADLARQELAAYKNLDTSCLTQSIQESVAADAGGSAVSGISVTPTSAPSGGDGGFGYHVSATISAQGRQVPLSVDFLMIFVGRAGIELTSVSIGSQTVPDQLQRSLLAKMVARAS